MRILQSLTADPVNGLNFSSVFVTTAFFLKKSKSIVMRAGLTETVTVGRCQYGMVSLISLLFDELFLFRNSSLFLVDGVPGALNADAVAMSKMQKMKSDCNIAAI
jgi:hypothetical protein